MKDSALQSEIEALLRGGQAHAETARILENVGAAVRHKRVMAGLPTIWELLEHLRLAQEDIVRYTFDESWVSPPWPEGYWPKKTGVVDDERWNSSRRGFLEDLEDLIAKLKDPDLDLTARIPHGGDHTYLREFLLVADHNAYHLAQIVQQRKQLGDWRSG